MQIILRLRYFRTQLFGSINKAPWPLNRGTTLRWHLSQAGLTVTLLDGTVYKTSVQDFMFTDALSIVHDKQRIYIPKTSIKSIFTQPGRLSVY
jgi:hypothetical protein